MRGFVFSGILLTYVLVLAATGYLTFVRFPTMDILPTPPMIQALGSDSELKADMLEDVKAARQRSADLIKLSAHSFDVTLGALLGFLSALAAGAGLTGQSQAPHAGSTDNPSVGRDAATGQ